MLDAIFDLYNAYLWLIDGPRAVLRLVRRIRHPTSDEKAVAGPPEMKRFWRNVWLVAALWVGLSLLVGIWGASPWFVVIAVAMGLLFLPGQVERRFDRLVVALRPVASSMP